MDASELQHQILAAFAAVSRPGRDDIAPHVCMECAELANDLAPFSVTEIPDEFFQSYVSDVPLLSAEAKHYYLPAWLIRGLDDSGPWLSDAASVVLLALEDPGHRWDPVQPYSRDQWLAIQEWLLFVESIDDDIDGERIEVARKRVANGL